MEHGLTQEDLAHQAGQARTHYQQIERGFWKKDQPAILSLKIISRLAKVLEVGPGHLLPSGSDARRDSGYPTLVIVAVAIGG